LHTATDPDCYTLTFDYDSIDRPTRITYPDSTYQSITYNRLDPKCCAIVPAGKHD
jgi:uncharacterized protein RhaS with RHS repeats